MNSGIVDKLIRSVSLIDRITVLHDFFIDRIIKLTSKDDLINYISQKSNYGGGSIRDIPTVDLKGGNAVNVAYCLARLGAKVNLFTISDDFGNHLLDKTFSEYSDQVDIIIRKGRPGYTTSLEFNENGGQPFNLMLSDIGDNNHFGPEKFSKRDVEIFNKSNAVVILNWASNLDSNRLCHFIFENSKNSLFYIDPADIETRKEEFKVFLKDNSDFIDILSINENECFSLLSSIGISYPKDDLSDEKGLKSISKTLAEAFEIDINIHTRMGSVWSNGKETEFAYSYPAEPNIITGAGDTWDAANLLGYLTDMEPSERLDFANLIASLYLESTGAIPPDIEYLKLHLKNIY